MISYTQMSCGELEELTYVINKETSAFIKSFEEWHDFIIKALYPNSHLLPIPKFLQFDKFTKTSVRYFLLDVTIHA